MFTVRWSLASEGQDYAPVCKWLVDICEKASAPDEFICMAMDASLDENYLIRSLSLADDQ